MEIKRDRYLNQLISYMWDGQVKVITGIRRCGKSYLLRTLFRKHLLASGVDDSHMTFTRETATIDKLFYYRDAQADGLDTEEPVFTFTYRYGNDFIRIRFFTCRMFVTRVEIKENE